MPIVSRLSANGKFMTGDLQIDEINTSNNILRVSESSVAVEVFDEVSMNPALAKNIYSESTSRETPSTTNQGVGKNLESIVGPFGTTEFLTKVASTSAVNSFHVIFDTDLSLQYQGTFSVFAKANEVRYFSLTCDDQGSDGFYAIFDTINQYPHSHPHPYHSHRHPLPYSGFHKQKAYHNKAWVPYRLLPLWV